MITARNRADIFSYPGDTALMSAPTVESKPLNVVIVGAGLGGLAAAIALRRQGHRIKVLALH
jgi:NADPH-dependent 2,4-dienoyl-CoA reductase/sulfur reductase-like enzyme